MPLFDTHSVFIKRFCVITVPIKFNKRSVICSSISYGEKKYIEFEAIFNNLFYFLSNRLDKTRAIVSFLFGTRWRILSPRLPTVRLGCL